MSSPKIHRTAFVDPGARLGPGVTVGPFAVIEDRVELGPDTQVGPHAVIGPFVRMGARNRVYAHAVIGGAPQDLSFDGGETWVEIGDDNHLREAVTIHRSTDPTRPTRVGSHCLLMVNAHLGHDCQIGERVILTNDVNLGGHVVVGDGAMIGGGANLHQYVRVGRRAMVGGMTGVSRDVLPFSFVFGILARHYRLNVIGLRRAGIRGERYRALENAFRRLRAGEDLEGLPETPEVAQLKAWLRAPSKRGRAPFATPGAKAGR